MINFDEMIVADVYFHDEDVDRGWYWHLFDNRCDFFDYGGPFATRQQCLADLEANYPISVYLRDITIIEDREDAVQ